MHLNHSCEPNLRLQGQIVFVAFRDIAAGEELTVDYAMTDDEPYEMECHCGSQTCRKLITGADWQKPELAPPAASATLPSRASCSWRPHVPPSAG